MLRNMGGCGFASRDEVTVDASELVGLRGCTGCGGTIIASSESSSIRTAVNRADTYPTSESVAYPPRSARM